MSSLSFQPIKPVELGLYNAVNTVAQKVSVYWLLLNGNPPQGNLAAADTWNLYSGCHLFIPSGKRIQDLPVNELTAFVQALKGVFGSQANARWVGWLSDPSNVPGSLTSVSANLIDETQARTITQLNLALSNMTLNFPQHSSLTFDPDPGLSPNTPSLSFDMTTSGGPLALTRTSSGINLNPDAAIIVPLGGAAAGAALFHGTWDRGQFYNLFMDDLGSSDTPGGSETRFFYGPAASAQTLRYPVFPPAEQSQDPTMQLALNITLDPLNVWDSERTRFGLDVSKFAPQQSGGPELPTSDSFRTTDGHILHLVPQHSAGYAMGRRPQGQSTDGTDSYSYLAPVGLFNAQRPSNVSGSPAASDPTAIQHAMCGLTGTEYLLLAPGATVEFVTGMNAWAEHFTPPSNGGGPTTPVDPCNPGDTGEPVVPGHLLTEEFTTSWIRINPSTSPPGGVDYGYAVQPEASVYYSTVQKPSTSLESKPYTYPMALGCRVSRLEDKTSQSPRVPVPVASYGGVWPEGFKTPASPGVLKAFESQIISATRHATAPKDMDNGPTFFDPVTHKGFEGGYAKSPEGLLLQLNNNGTINTLFLAKSPNKQPVEGAAQLAFHAFDSSKSNIVSPWLSNAIMNDNLFMVVTNYDSGDANTKLGGFDNEIQVGEWTFRLDVGYTEDQQKSPNTILVFKFTTAFSLVDLVANAAYWQEWQNFIGDASKVKTVQGQLLHYLCTANPKGQDPNNPYGGDLFKDFWAKATDPNWTGILAINCGLDDADLPDDLQDLLGGIDGELRAHHFGINVSRINDKDKTRWEIDQTSLFALIHYKKDYKTPPSVSDFGFQVLKLNALFENSSLVHFDSRIAVTIPQLFGSNVLLTTSSGDKNVPAGYNVLEIDGVYQKHGDKGTVIFDTKTPQVFSFKTTPKTGFRALKEVYVTDAALVPVSSRKDSGKITVLSNFALTGMLMFADDVSTDAQGGKKGSGLDIFSYGDAKLINGLGFTAYNIGMKTEIQNNVGHLASIAPDLSAFRVTPATSTVRGGSLVSALPLKLIDFLQGPSSSGWPVTFDGQSKKSSFAAKYALQFQVSLGSLGALSALADSLDVDLLMGWLPAAVDTDNDQIWMLMVPPKAMLGQQGFGIQGVLDTTFRSVEVVVQKWPKTAPPDPIKVYGVYFKDIQMHLLGLQLIPVPAAQSNFTLFADPKQGNSSNLGWLMTLRAPQV